MQKVTLLAKLTKKHRMVVAFDSRPISLAVLRDQLRELLKNQKARCGGGPGHG